MLRSIRCLFLSLLRFVFRLGSGLLRLHVVKLATRNVSFTSRLLNSRPWLLTLSNSNFRHVSGVFRVVTGALFLFIRVRFFSMMSRFLLRAILIVVRTRNLFRYVNGALLRFNRALFLMKDSDLRRVKSVNSLLARLLFGNDSFLLARIRRHASDLFRDQVSRDPFLLARFLHVVLHRRVQRARWHNGPIRHVQRECS